MKCLKNETRLGLGLKPVQTLYAGTVDSHKTTVETRKQSHVGLFLKI